MQWGYSRESEGERQWGGVVVHGMQWGYRLTAERVRGRGSGGCRSAWHAVGLQLRGCGGEAVGGCRSSMQWGRSPEIEGERYRGCVAVACSGVTAEKVRGRDSGGVS